MTRAQRIRDLTSEKAWVVRGECFVTPRVFAQLQRDLASESPVIRLPSGVTIIPTDLAPNPTQMRRAKKFVRRLHRARLKNRGKPWI